jgi:hypothetical protein
VRHAYPGSYPGKFSLNGCLEGCGDLLLRQGKGVMVVAPGWVTAGKVVALVVIEVLGY